MKTLIVFIVAALGPVLAEISFSGHMMNFMDYVEDSAELVDDEIIKKCVENIDQLAYQRAKLARHQLTECGTALLHTDKLLTEVRAAALSGGQGMGPIVKKFCKSYQISGHSCLITYLSDLTPCLNETEKEKEKLVVQIAKTSWDYACQKDGLRATLFFKDSTLSCIDAQSPGLIQCIAPYFTRLRAAGDPTRTVADILVNKECSTYASATRCIVNQLQQCSDLTAANIVGGSFNETLRISPCANYDEKVLIQPRKSSFTLQHLQEVHSQKMAFLGKLESTLGRLEALQTSDSEKQDTVQQKIIATLNSQTLLLEKVLTSLEDITIMLMLGRSKKW